MLAITALRQMIRLGGIDSGYLEDVTCLVNLCCKWSGALVEEKDVLE